MRNRAQFVLIGFITRVIAFCGGPLLRYSQNGLVADFEVWQGLQLRGKVVFVAGVVHSCACCLIESFSDGSVHVLAALHELLCVLRSARLHSLFLAGT